MQQQQQALLRIGTPFGVRVEIFRAWPGGEDLLLLASNDFCAQRNGQVFARVCAWEADTCSVRKASVARLRADAVCKMTTYDASCSSDDEDHEKKRGKKSHEGRKRAHEEPPQQKERKRRNKKRRSEEEAYEIELSDFKSHVFYVWVIVFEGHDKSIAPHPPSQFRVENCCGSCKSLFELNFDLLKAIALPRKEKGGARGEQIATVAGTFAICAPKYKVDFRGVRCFRLMARTWEEITRGMRLEETDVGVYLLVLKANVGMPILLANPVQYGAVLDATATEGCYIANRLRQCCSETALRTEVCETVVLKGIKWASLVSNNARLPKVLAESQSCIHISRKGGVMMRIVMSEVTWSPELEDSVLAHSNSLLETLRCVLKGKAAF